MPNNNEQQSNGSADAPPPLPDMVEQLAAEAMEVMGDVDPATVGMPILRRVIDRYEARYEVVARVSEPTPSSLRLALAAVPGASGVVVDFGADRPAVRLVFKGGEVRRALLPARR